MSVYICIHLAIASPWILENDVAGVIFLFRLPNWLWRPVGVYPPRTSHSGLCLREVLSSTDRPQTFRQYCICGRWCRLWLPELGVPLSILVPVFIGHSSSLWLLILLGISCFSGFRGGSLQVLKEGARDKAMSGTVPHSCQPEEQSRLYCSKACGS